MSLLHSYVRHSTLRFQCKILVKGGSGYLRVNQFWLQAKDRLKTVDKLSEFGAIDFGKFHPGFKDKNETSFNFLKAVGKEVRGNNFYERGISDNYG